MPRGGIWGEAGMGETAPGLPLPGAGDGRSPPGRAPSLHPSGHWDPPRSPLQTRRDPWGSSPTQA